MTASPAPASKTVIERRPGWAAVDFAELWRRRILLWFFILRDAKTRYRQMALGPLWVVIDPVVNTVVFTVIFGAVAKLPSDGLPYPLFAYVALFPWNFFAGATKATSGSLSGYMGLISKVYFPRLLAPLSYLFSSLLDVVFQLPILLGMLFYYHIPWRAEILIAPLYLGLAALCSLAIGLWMATLQVRYRDIAILLNYLLRFWLYATPVAYSASLFHQRLRFLLEANPLYWIVEGFRWSLLGNGRAPNPAMIPPFVVMALLLVGGIYYFRRTERSIIDLA